MGGRSSIFWTALVLAAAGCGSEPEQLVADAMPGDVTTTDVAAQDDAPPPVDATIDESTDASVEDASVDSAAETSVNATADGGPTDASDAGVDATSLFCGDGIRGLDEECDDMTANPSDLCSSLCEVREQLAFRAPGDGGPVRQRTLGTGRHPIGVAPNGSFAVAWLEPQVPLRMGMTFYSPAGVPSGVVDAFGVGSTPSAYAAPVVAALPNGKFAVAWVDNGGDGEGLGIVARIVDPNVPSSGAPVRVNQTTQSSQFDVDMVWTGTELVLAWTDMSVFPSDVRMRTFDAALNAKTPEQTLAGTSANEGNVALALANGSLAAAWRVLSGAQESVRVKIGSATFDTPAAAIGPYTDPPALTSLDPTHGLLVYEEAIGNNDAKLRAAVIDVNVPGLLAPVDLAPLAQGDAGATTSQYRPAAVTVGTRVFVGWTQEAKLADPRADELWLKEVGWNGSALDLTQVEVTLPRWDNHRPGDQRFPALSASGLGPGGALVVGWVDQGGTMSGSATMDVVTSLFPVPVLRKSNADGGGS
jgi:cysteine-rich repeat protein